MERELSTFLTNSTRKLSFIMVLSLKEHMKMENGKKEHILGQVGTNTLEHIKTTKDGMVK